MLISNPDDPNWSAALARPTAHPTENEAMTREITVTVSGPVGCGKSAIAGEIEIALRAIGVPVRFADEADSRSEKNMTGADWTGYLDMYQPRVVIVEKIEALKGKQP